MAGVMACNPGRLVRLAPGSRDLAGDRRLAFFDAKRPVTIDVLKSFDLRKLSPRLNAGTRFLLYLNEASFLVGLA